MLFAVLKDLLAEAISSTKGFAARKRAATDGPAGPVLGKSEEEADCRRTLESTPNLAEAHNQLGVILKNAHRMREAEAAFRRAICLQQSNVAAHYNLAIVLAEIGHPWEAEAAYRTALKLQPDFVEAHNNLGVVLMKSRRLAEAETAFRRARELAPGFADAQRNLSVALPEAKRVAGARGDRGDASELISESARSHRDLQAAISRANAPGEMEAAYRTALETEPDFVDAWNGLGVLLAEARRFTEAEAALRRALDLRPGFADAHSNLGAVFKDTGRFAEAEASFGSAIALDPDHGAAHANLDFVQREIERLSAAVAARRRGIGRRPGDALASYRLGLALTALGRLNEAVASFGQVLALEPDHVRARNRLGVALARKGQSDDAIVAWLEAIAIKPDYATAMANLGAACYAKRELDQATTWNEAALALEPRHAGANQIMAAILRDRGKQEAARQYLERAHRGPAVDVQHAAAPRRTALVLWTRHVGNIPTIEFLFPATVNTRINWVVESAGDDESDEALEYDLAFNAMGDQDVARDSVDPVRRFAETCTKPLLNHPDKVARTARHNLPMLLAGIDDVCIPPVWRLAGAGDWDDSLVDQLPLLIRPVESHGGSGLELVTTAVELAQRRSLQSGPVYVTRFFDFRSADSWYRKYRMIFVDRKPYPCNLAISQKWLVHYFTADMESHPWKLEEEKRFLDDPERVLGRANMAAIQSIGARMDLEYSGIDFSITGDGRILVFEANPTMLIHPEAIGGPLRHKNAYVFRIQQRFEEMLERLCG